MGKRHVRVSYSCFALKYIIPLTWALLREAAGVQDASVAMSPSVPSCLASAMNTTASSGGDSATH